MASPTGQLQRSGAGKVLRISYQSDERTGRKHPGTLPDALADRIVFSVDQTAFKNTTFLRKQYQRSENTNMDFSDRLFDYSDHSQGNETSGYSSQNISNFEHMPIFTKPSP